MQWNQTLPSAMHLKSATAADIPILRQLNIQALKGWGREGLFMPMSGDFLTQMIQEGIVLMLEQDVRVLGYSIAVPAGFAYPPFMPGRKNRSTGLLFGTALDPALRGQGWQRQLIRLRLDVFRSADIWNVQSTVSPFNTPSLDNLLRVGFHIVSLNVLLDGYPRFILQYDFGQSIVNGKRRSLVVPTFGDLSEHAALLAEGFVAFKLTKKNPATLMYASKQRKNCRKSTNLISNTKNHQTDHRPNLRQRITLTATGALVAVSITLIAYAEIRISSLARHHEAVRLNIQTDLLQTMLSLYRERLGTLARQVAADPTVNTTFLENAVTPQVYQALEFARGQLPERPTLALFSSDGQVLIDSGNGLEVMNATIPRDSATQGATSKIIIEQNDLLIMVHYAPARRGDKIVGHVGAFMPVSDGMKTLFPDLLGLAFLDETGRLQRLTGEFPDTTVEIKPDKKQQARALILSDNEKKRRLEFTLLPLQQDISSVSGELVLIRNITNVVQRQELLTKLTLSSTLLIITLSLGLLMRALRHGFRPLHAVIRLLEIMTKGETRLQFQDTGAEMPLYRLATSKEIGTLLDAVERFRASLHARDELIAIQEQLTSARRIQQSLLPIKINLHPNLECHGTMRPAQGVGGDFFDIFQLKNGRVAVLIADVSGKGIAAALFAAQVSALVRARCLQSDDLATVIQEANTALCDRNPEDMFVSIILATVTPENGKFSFVNAGHCPPMITNTDGEVRLLETEPEPVLGVVPSLTWTQHHINLSQDDRLLLYSDGFDEAQSKEEALLGTGAAMKMFADACSKTRKLSGGDVCKYILDNIDIFVGVAPQADDITLLTLFLREDGLSSDEHAR